MKIRVKHLEDVGETYFEHGRKAAGFSLKMILGGLACLTHALVPSFFVHTGSNCIASLYERMVVERRDKIKEHTKDVRRLRRPPVRKSS